MHSDKSWKQPAFGLLIAGSFALSLFGCGGGGGGSSSVPAGGSAGAGLSTANTTLSLTVPNAASGSSAARSAQSVPSAINGVTVYAYAASGTQPSVPTLVGDLSLTPSGGNKTLCVAASAGRSCTIAFAAPVGTDTVSIQLYDAEPVSGSIPSTANLVASGMTSLTVSLNGSNAASIILNSVAGTVNSDGSATFNPLIPSGNSAGITGGAVTFAIPAGGVPAGEQVGVSEVLQLTLPLSSVRSPQTVTTSTPTPSPTPTPTLAPTPTPVPTPTLPAFGPGSGNTFIYGIGFTISGGSAPLTQPLIISAAFQISAALASTLGLSGTFYIAQQTASSYTLVGSAAYTVSGTTLTVTGSKTGIVQPGIYVLYLPGTPPTPTPIPTATICGKC